MPSVIARGLIGSALLCMGGFFYARLPIGVGIARDPLLRSVRGSSEHLGVGLAIGFTGLVLLTWAWVDLRRAARHPLTGVRAVRTAVACWTVPLILAPPLYSGDGWSYVATGYLTGHGLSPYQWTPSVLALPLRSGVNPRWLDTPTPYGPLPLGWGGAISQVTSNPWLLLFGYRVLALIGLALLAWATPRLARRSGVAPGLALWLVVASPFMLAQGIGGLHNDLVMAGLGAVALCLTRRDHWVWGAVLVGAAAAVKLPGGLAAVGVVLLSLRAGAGYVDRLRRSAQVAAVALATLFGLGVVTGVGAGWISALSVPAQIPSRLSLTRRVGLIADQLLGGIHGPLLHGASTVGAFQAAGFGAALLVVVAVVLRHRTSDDPAVLRTFAVLMLATTVLSPVVHYWYFLWCLPMLAWVPLRAPARAALCAAVGVLGLTAVADASLHVNWLTTGAELALLVVPFLAAAQVVDRRRRQPVG